MHAERAGDVMEIGIIGLGKIGAGLAVRALDLQARVVGFDKGAISARLLEAGLERVTDLTGFRRLSPPRTVFLYIPAGAAVDSVLDDLAETLERRDAVIDGGNSYWGDSIRRQQRCAQRGLGFIDLGTSGGIQGARQGPCLMAGGAPADVQRVEPILRALATEGGYVHAGPPGAGHLVKLVHNGIEFGMLQALGEGMSLLERSPLDLNIQEVLRCWRHGSVIRGWLVELLEEGYRQRGGLDDVPAYVEDTGEVAWLIEDAMRMEVAVPVIAQAVMQLQASRDDQQDWARAIAVMRRGFGGHPLGPDEAIAQARPRGRVGPFPLD